VGQPARFVRGRGADILGFACAALARGMALVPDEQWAGNLRVRCWNSWLFDSWSSASPTLLTTTISRPCKNDNGSTLCPKTSGPASASCRAPMTKSALLLAPSHALVEALTNDQEFRCFATTPAGWSGKAQVRRWLSRPSRRNFCCSKSDHPRWPSERGPLCVIFQRKKTQLAKLDGIFKNLLTKHESIYVKCSMQGCCR
jgi:hypothetical protein